MKLTFDVPAELAPAFRSAVEDASATLAKRLERPWAPKTERALTQAVAAFGILRAAVNADVPKADPHYTVEVPKRAP